MSETIAQKPTPYERLFQIPTEALLPSDIQAAINCLDPSSPEGVQQAEEVLGYAEAGVRLHPGDRRWDEVHERADKIFRHRVALKQGNDMKGSKVMSKEIKPWLNPSAVETALGPIREISDPYSRLEAIELLEQELQAEKEAIIGHFPESGPDFSLNN